MIHPDYFDDSFDEYPTPNRLAVAFWGSLSLAAFMEARPLEAITLETRRALERMPYNEQPLLSEYGFPDFRAVREELGLSIADLADLFGEEDETDIILAIEYGFRDLTLSAALRCCMALRIPLGVLFHDRDYQPRPMTRIRRDHDAGKIMGFWI